MTSHAVSGWPRGPFNAHTTVYTCFLPRLVPVFCDCGTTPRRPTGPGPFLSLDAPAVSGWGLYTSASKAFLRQSDTQDLTQHIKHSSDTSYVILFIGFFFGRVMNSLLRAKVPCIPGLGLRQRSLSCWSEPPPYMSTAGQTSVA